MSIFDKMPIPKGSRGTFPLNKMHTTTMDFFRWDVAHCMPLVPHDVVNLNLHSFVQAAPNPFPINGRMSVGTYAFYVPTRIVWEGWTKYITDLQSGLTIPYFTVTDLWNAINTTYIPPAQRNDVKRYISNIMNLSSLMQFIEMAQVTDIPSKIATLKLSAIPLRCAQRIWFDWMRDKAHISDASLSSYCTTSGGHINITELVQLITAKYRCYPKNYITTAFDSPSEVSASAASSFTTKSVMHNAVDGQDNPGVPSSIRSALIGTIQQQNINRDAQGYGSSSILGTQIQDLRSSNSLQNYAERMLVAGKTVLSRFQALFGTNPTIEELQMSDYLGGHEEDLLFQTTNTGGSKIADNGTTLNTVGAFGYHPSEATMMGQKGQDITSGSNGVGIDNVTYKSDEHGYLFVFCAITPIPQYFQGLDRDWFRGLDTFASDKFDFFHQDFENEGLQPVLNYEVCLSDKGDTKYDPKGVFGFQQKYIDFKYTHDSLGADFVLAASSSLFSQMHLGRDVQALVESLAAGGSVNDKMTPAILTQATLADEASFDSKFSITNKQLDHFIVNHKIVVTANRPMMQNALPALDASSSRVTSKDLIETSGFRL